MLILALKYFSASDKGMSGLFLSCYVNKVTLCVMYLYYNDHEFV